MRIEKKGDLRNFIREALRSPRETVCSAEEEAQNTKMNENLKHFLEEVEKPVRTMHFTNEEFLSREPCETAAELEYREHYKILERIGKYREYGREHYSNYILKEMQAKNYLCGPISILAMMGQEPLMNLVHIDRMLDEEKIGDYLETDSRNGKKGMTVLDFAGLATKIIPEGEFSPTYKKVHAQIWVFADFANLMKHYAQESVQRGGKTISKPDLQKDGEDLANRGVRTENAMLDRGDIAFLIKNKYNVAINYNDHYVVAYGVDIKYYEDGTKYADIMFFDPETGENADSKNILELREHLAEGLPVEGVAINIQMRVFS